MNRTARLGLTGAVILRPETDAPIFTPRAVVSELPPADEAPWPMGDVLPDGPLDPSINEDLLDQAAEVFFGNTEDRRAAFVVLYRGRIVKEVYGSGAHQDMQLESWSMGKSMTATLIGRLVQMGHFGIWDPAPIPQWQTTPGDPRAEIRIADLLRMSSGLRFSGGGSTREQMDASWIPGVADHGMGYQAPIDIFQFSVSRDLEHAPNTVGRYRNSDPWTLGYIVRRTVENELGEEYLTWPQRELFDKIGIRRFVAETDIYGNFILTGYNYGTARDWARFGQLYLQRGTFNGERLLPAEFVDFVSTPAPAWEEPQYGGLFWTNHPDSDGDRAIPSLPADMYRAVGAGRQATYVIPSREMVIVVMSHRAGDRRSPDRNEREFEALGLAVKAIDPSWTW
ncbi:MAG: serine hydrolase [Gemmatimonadota bacterium]